jgi:LysR family transcriptional regulator, benzoate and cis,cis-muconate-responsive activator of ben and cat genes
MFDHSFLEMQIYFAAVAEQGSFHRAAKLLNTDPSFLTRKIGRLEKTLGVKLFVRSTRKMILTPAGTLLLPEMQTSLRHAERAWGLAHYHMRLSKGPLRVGYSPLIASHTLLLLYRLDLAELEKGRMGVSLDVPEPRAVFESATTHKLVDLVLHGDLQAGIGIAPVEESGLWVESLTREPFSICLSRNHPLSHRPGVSIRDLHGQVVFWIARRLNPAFYDLVTKYVESTGAEVVYQEVGSIAQAIELVACGLGLALVPRSASRISYTGILFKDVTDRYLRTETVLFGQKNIVQGPLSEVFRLLLARLRDQRTWLQ